MEVYLGRKHTYRLPPYGHWNIQLTQKEPALVKFNLTTAVGVAVGIYGSKSRIPSHTKYDFVEVIGAGVGVPTAPSRPARSSPEQKAALLPPHKTHFVEFVRFLDRGTWFISIFNDGPETQEISLVPTVACKKTLLHYASDWRLNSFFSFLLSFFFFLFFVFR